MDLATQAARPAELPDGFLVRAVTLNDLDAAVALFNRCSIAMIGTREYTVDELRTLWQTPGFDTGTSTRVVITPDGTLCGYMAVWDLRPVPVHIMAFGRVDPVFEGLGIGTYLMHWAEIRARHGVARVPGEMRVTLQAMAPSTYAPATGFLHDRDMRVVRQYWRMMIELNQAPAAPHWPVGMVVRTCQEYLDVHAIFQAETEIFRDHWGHVDQPEAEMFRRWQYWWQARLGQSEPALWFLACVGEEIVGMTFGDPRAPDDPAIGYISTVGVRRPWRRQGVGLALLQHAFGALYQRGQARVGLDVDAESLTHATRLYQRAGMTVARQTDLYEKALQAGTSVGTAAPAR